MRACVFVIIIIQRRSEGKKKPRRIFRPKPFYSYAKRWIKLYIFTHGNVVICKFIYLIHTQTGYNISLGCFHLNHFLIDSFFFFFFFFLFSFFLLVAVVVVIVFNFGVSCVFLKIYLFGVRAREKRRKDKSLEFAVEGLSNEKKSCFSFSQLRYQPEMVLLTKLVIFFIQPFTTSLFFRSRDISSTHFSFLS